MSKELDNVVEVLNTGVMSGYRGAKEGHKGGKFTQLLESQFRDYFKVKHALAVSSGTTGLITALKACGVNEGDRVLTTPVTFSATSSSILHCGATPVFNDVDYKTYNMVPSIREGIKAILPVHLMGYPADMAEINRCAQGMKAKVVEDCCQSIGAKYRGQLTGTFGDVGIFSFNQGKQVSCGEGGMLITNDDEIAYNAGMIRNHGETQSNILGYNFRMTEFQAAVASARFERLDETLKAIRELCEAFTEEVQKIPGIEVSYIQQGCTHSYMYYPLRINKEELGMDRDTLQLKLKDKGVYFGLGGYKPLYKIPVYAMYGGDFPNVESMYSEVMFTNIFRPPMTIHEVKGIASTLKSIVSGVL